MRWTQSLIPTLREAPADAEIASHQLLLRAGLIRKLAGGVYTFLPLGLRALRKIERIIREEMDAAGALEVAMPALQPPEIWEASGRAQTAGDVLFKLKDSSGRQWFLSPTAEEVITTLAANEINSYRQLPKNFYQISVKFRDEIRPRYGLMRAKEFIMKDAYSFDTTDEGAMASYQKMFDAYKRIFARCGLQAFPVEADTGVIGGSHSHEFMIPAATGENEVAYCEACGYAANIEKATSNTFGSIVNLGKFPAIKRTKAGFETINPDEPSLEEISSSSVTVSGVKAELIDKFPTPGVVTIEALAKEPYKITANRQIKTLVFIADSKPILILIRGDDQLNETKLKARTGAVAARPATADEIFELLGARPGSLGAVAATLERRFPNRLGDDAGNQRADLEIGAPKIFADERLRGANDMTTGANEDGFHLKNVSIERDIKVTQWLDLRTVKAGEPCPHCTKEAFNHYNQIENHNIPENFSILSAKPLKIRRAIEVGHVFKLGTKYSEKLNAMYLDEKGARNFLVMGCYGIGVTRTLQAVVEQSNDKDGIIWPLAVAPYSVCITLLAVAPGSPAMALAETLYNELTARGVDVILDDRDDRPGVKFKDSELVGFPIRIGIGEKSLAKGEVELKPRNAPLQAIKAEDAVEAVMKLVNG